MQYVLFFIIFNVSGARGDPYPAGDTEVYDLSNEHRMGLTEIQAVREMQKGVEAIINHEKSLEA